MTSVLRSYFLSQKQSYFPRPLKETEKHVISLVFHESDAGHKGYLSREDLKVATVSLFGYKPSKYEVDKMFFRGQAEEEELAPLS
ncbi:EF-hand calcium-binding domain-containing protein 11-like [Lingula anatina]|uniref:EF-hand calcium-binding domain-containing protein 11-like n=1 Tax=Lingula anatina TaxID=7574 RepID=A0A1S3HKI4_LINAN|nr:EF-hand calcium-binding domain-containing protein 11-like [Lingula anatina]|eukprot:XP_013385976.1 EF-hand calcium-binding domain-containing protein 11-like [Lingula anatina]